MGPQRKGVKHETGGRSLLLFRKLCSKSLQEFLPFPSEWFLYGCLRCKLAWPHSECIRLEQPCACCGAHQYHPLPLQMGGKEKIPCFAKIKGWGRRKCAQLCFKPESVISGSTYNVCPKYAVKSVFFNSQRLGFPKSHSKIQYSFYLVAILAQGCLALSLFLCPAASITLHTTALCGAMQ